MFRPASKKYQVQEELVRSKILKFKYYYFFWTLNKQLVSLRSQKVNSVTENKPAEILKVIEGIVSYLQFVECTLYAARQNEEP